MFLFFVRCFIAYLVVSLLYYLLVYCTAFVLDMMHLSWKDVILQVAAEKIIAGFVDLQDAEKFIFARYHLV